MSNVAIPIEQIRGQVDFAIITIRQDEFEAVLDRFAGRSPVSRGKQLYEFCHTSGAQRSRYSVAVVRSLEQGQTPVQAVAHDVIEDLDPNWLLLVGIAGGVPDREFTLGDVLLASRMHDFSVTAAIEGRRPQFQQTGGPMHPEVKSLLAAIPAWRDRLGDWNSEVSNGSRSFRQQVRDSLTHHFPVTKPIRQPLYHVGPAATSNT